MDHISFSFLAESPTTSSNELVNCPSSGRKKKAKQVLRHSHHTASELHQGIRRDAPRFGLARPRPDSRSWSQLWTSPSNRSETATASSSCAERWAGGRAGKGTRRRSPARRYLPPGAAALPEQPGQSVAPPPGLRQHTELRVRSQACRSRAREVLLADSGSHQRGGQCVGTRIGGCHPQASPRAPPSTGPEAWTSPVSKALAEPSLPGKKR